MARHIACIGEMIMYTIFWLENLKGRPRRRWVVSIRMDLKGNMEGSCGLDTAGSV
jgi:hypothetical protein